jgi:phosphate transport system substrate-binding protein
MNSTQIPMPNLKRLFALTAVGLAVAAVPVVTFAQATTSLKGAGATFPDPLYKAYFASNGFKTATSLNVQYNGIGSGGGIKQMIAETVDFGASDAAMTDEEIAKVKRGVVMVPTAGGAVAVVYNLPGVANLKLSRKTLPAIFSGKITKWNDPAIAADNPTATLPDKSIRLAVRADGSGTSFVFTNHLSAIDPNFSSKIGATKTPNWSNNPLKAKGNDGVANIVQQTEGAIGYVESSFAKNLTKATIENKAGRFVAPSVLEANRAMKTIRFPENYRVFEGDPEDGYPITGLTWLLIYREYSDAAKAEGIKKMVKWILTDGQKLNNGLEYTAIPSETAAKVIATVENTIKTASR